MHLSRFFFFSKDERLIGVGVLCSSSSEAFSPFFSPLAAAALF